MLLFQSLQLLLKLSILIRVGFRLYSCQKIAFLSWTQLIFGKKKLILKLVDL